MGRRIILFIGVVCALMAIAGCTAPVQQSAQDGFGVVFDGAPLLSDEKIYYLGAPVGEIAATIGGGPRVTKLIVRLQPEFAARAGTHLAFFAHGGRLEAVLLATMGQPLQNGAILSGFTSKTDLRWFKLKTLLRDRAAAAGRRAELLNRRMG